MSCGYFHGINVKTAIRITLTAPPAFTLWVSLLAEYVRHCIKKEKWCSEAADSKCISGKAVTVGYRCLFPTTIWTSVVLSPGTYRRETRRTAQHQNTRGSRQQKTDWQHTMPEQSDSRLPLASETTSSMWLAGVFRQTINNRLLAADLSSRRPRNNAGADSLIWPGEAAVCQGSPAPEYPADVAADDLRK